MEKARSDERAVREKLEGHEATAEAVQKAAETLELISQSSMLLAEAGLE